MNKNLFLYVDADDETTDNFYVYKNNRDITMNNGR